MTALKITWPDKNETDAPGTPNRVVTATDMNAIKAALNNHATKIDEGYRVFPSMPSLEDLADGEVAFVVSGGVVPDPDPDPELINLSKSPNTAITYTSSTLHSLSGNNVEKGWNELLGSTNTAEATSVTYSEDDPMYFQVEFGAAKTVLKLQMTHHISTRGIKGFKLSASNNGSDWTDLIAQTESPDNNNVVNEWNIQSPGSYKYYRVQVYSNFRTDNPGYISAWDLRLIGEA